ncbi:MAG: (d)CMP kinase [Bacteroidales bacterium]|nr:(d)CMP kinase [Bacteroidales bacterium]
MNQPDNPRRIIIAIDGYSSSGKSTMAKSLARAIGYKYVDTGAMYRAVTLYAMRNGMISDNHAADAIAIEKALPSIDIAFSIMPDGSQHTILNGEDVEDQIRRMDVSDNVSPVSAIPAVRHHLVKQQQAFGSERGIVMDGRDIGTTVFPDAELKIFVNAPAATRAERRVKELRQKGIDASYEEVLANVVSRDHQDETRAESPLRRADDAVDLDNSGMSIPQQDAFLINLYQERIGKK